MSQNVELVPLKCSLLIYALKCTPPSGDTKSRQCLANSSCVSWWWKCIQELTIKWWIVFFIACLTDLLHLVLVACLSHLSLPVFPKTFALNLGFKTSLWKPTIDITDTTLGLDSVAVTCRTLTVPTTEQQWFAPKCWEGHTSESSHPIPSSLPSVNNPQRTRLVTSLHFRDPSSPVRILCSNSQHTLVTSGYSCFT